MPTQEEKARAHRYIDMAEELFRHSGSACLVGFALGVATLAFDSDPWPPACVVGAAIGLHLVGRVYIHLARGLRMR